MARRQTTDIVIIGGGIIGLACAVGLAERGAIVHVLDTRPTPMGASAATTGLLIPPTRQAVNRLTAICQASAQMYPDWVAQLVQTTGIDPGYVASGALRLLAPDDQRTGEARPDYLNAAAVSGVMTHAAAHIQTGTLLQALDARLRALGGQRLTATVTGFSARRGRIGRVLLDDAAQLRASHVLICAGIGATRLLAPLGVTLPITAEAGQIVQIRHVAQLPDAILLDGDRALVAKADGRLHVTGPGDPQAILARVTALLGAGELHQVWRGMRPRIPGGVPVIGMAPGYANLSIAVGHGKNGFLLAPLTAQLIAETLVSAA